MLTNNTEWVFEGHSSNNQVHRLWRYCYVQIDGCLILYTSLELFGVSGFKIVAWLKRPISTEKNKCFYLRADSIP